jgi:4-diphosphocytidyl-2-C-methyl-D-erythritol kinase
VNARQRERVVVRAPAKINLQLAVGPLRPDGYHDLATVFHAVSLFDEIAVESSLPGSGLTLSVAGSFTELVPTDGTNLAHRAAVAVASECGVDPDLALTITKAIPVAAGLAGGSADAAATLVAVDAFLGNQLSKERLSAIAAGLGSDVPFSLSGGTAIGTSRGELLSPALTQGTLHWVLVSNSGVGLSTPSVYAELDRLREGSAIPPVAVSDQLMQALRAGDSVLVGRLLSNDLQRAALSLRPSLSQTIDIALDYGALGAIVSGSGPTVAILVRDPEHALDLTVALTSHGTADPIYRVHGPVPGARVVESY